MIGHPAWLPAVRFNSCSGLLSFVHTACIILRSVSLCIKRKYYIKKHSNTPVFRDELWNLCTVAHITKIKRRQIRKSYHLHTTISNSSSQSFTIQPHILWVCQTESASDWFSEWCYINFYMQYNTTINPLCFPHHLILQIRNWHKRRDEEQSLNLSS